MSYVALYRQWRPRSFEDVVGQEHITKTLKNQIESRRVAHAYLFCGSRGTGKTTTAKIFARAINCRQPKEGEPCDQCDVCKRIASENAMDIIEIDAASNNGVDEIRDLREKVKFPPTIGRYKVYIIDEVHMLSTGAFNALLKTLEEPPEHVVFILATTEPQKLPATILSRCQRYDFHRIRVDDIVGRLKTVAQGVDVSFDVEGLRLIARAAEGGMRDALSIMDQCISYCGSRIGKEDVIRVLGTADQSFFFETAGEILAGNTRNVLRAVDRMVEDGRDIGVFIRDLTLHFRNLLMVMVCGDCSELLDVTDEMMEEYKVQAAEGTRERIIRTIDGLAALESDLKWSSQPRIMAEVTLVKICRPEQEHTLEGLLDRIEGLEKALKSGIRCAEAEPKPSMKLAKEEAALVMPKDPADRKAVPAPKEEKKEPAVRDPEKAWPNILKRIRKEKMPLYMLITEGKLMGVKGGILTLSFPETGAFYATALEKEDNRKYIQEVVMKLTGKEVMVKCIVGQAKTEEQSSPEEAERLVIDRAIEVFGADMVEIVEDEDKE